MNIGDRFNSLVVVGPSFVISSGNQRRRMVVVRCDCGTHFATCVNHVKGGRSKTCGCKRMANMAASVTTHGGSAGKKRTRLYRIWKGMRDRCARNENYAGRDIKVCEAWNQFESFATWARSNGYRDNLTIDRIDNERGYEPKNCRWVSHKANSNNKRNNRFIKMLGETKTESEWAEDSRCVVRRHAFFNRIRVYGWKPLEALTTPEQHGIHLLIAFGEVKSIADWSRDFRCSVSAGAIERRIAYGWEPEDAIIMPVRKRKVA